MTLHNMKHLYNYTYCHEYQETLNVKSFEHIPLNVIRKFLFLYIFGKLIYKILDYVILTTYKKVVNHIIINRNIHLDIKKKLNPPIVNSLKALIAGNKVSDKENNKNLDLIAA